MKNYIQFYSMKNLLTPFLFLLFLSCSQEDNFIDTNTTVNSALLGVQPSSPPFQTTAFFYEDLPYSSGNRTQFDLFLPQDPSIDGVVILFHGGSFLYGSKADFYSEEFNEILFNLLEAGIAIVNANYSFISDSNPEGVFSALNDGTDLIDFITANHQNLGIPKNNLLLAGVSAGAGIAFWNGLGNTRPDSIKGILGLQAQSSYDLYSWETLFNDFKLDSIKMINSELEVLFNQFYGEEYSIEKANRLDYYNAIDANDPPFYVYNPVFEDRVFQNENLDFDILFHSFKHADRLRKKATEVALEFSGAYQESPQEFILRILTQ